MSNRLRSDDTSDLLNAAHTAEAIGNTICSRVGNDAPELIARVEAMRASLKTMLDHADRSLKASQKLRNLDDRQHRDHMREIVPVSHPCPIGKMKAS